MLYRRSFRLFSLLLFFALWSAKSNAVLVEVDFEEFDRVPIFVSEPYEENGFRFTPNCHYGALPGGPFFHTSNWMGFDLSGCLDLDEAIVRVEAINGSLFDLEYLFAVEPDFMVRSSKGGLFAVADVVIATDDKNITFSGDDWTDVSWIEFFADVGDPVGFDNVRFDIARIPEPAALALILPGLLWLARRRNQHES